MNEEVNEPTSEETGDEGDEVPDQTTGRESDEAVDELTDEPASEAFARLGNETRMAILEALADVERGRVRPAVRGFTDLYEATDEETTAGFSYHLRQLRDAYVEKTEDGYRLTYAGLRVVREIAAGTYTERFDLEPVDVPDPCPLCGGHLTASGEDNVLTVSCRDCDGDVLSLSFPPGGHATHDEEDLLAAFDRHHRHRVRQLREGSCPDCGGATNREVSVEEETARASLACRACGYAVRCPVALTVIEHPAVVSLFYEHGEDVCERPVWNVGPEWTETVLSADPVCVRVGVGLGDDHLALLVGADCSVGHAERSSVDPPGGARREGTHRGGPGDGVDGESDGDGENDAADATTA